ncbi:MAG: flagellar hook-length control protein FliK [Spirochaetes bacterium]|nr:flagellar hook-length control protein FliK [Spirochaetota bacterium]
MFDHLKIDQSSVGNLPANHERDLSKNISAKTGSDFFSMLIEQTRYDNKKSQVESDYREREPERNFAKDNFNQPVKISNDEIRTEDANNENIQLSKDRDGLQHKHIDETNEKTHKEIEKGKSSSLKELNDKSGNKLSEGDNSIVLQLQSENNIKRLMEIIKAVLNGDKKNEDDSYKKLFSNLKFNNDKPNRGLTEPHIKTGAENNHKALDEIISKITKEFKESISKELSKILEDRRSIGKQHHLTDRELKDIALNIIEGIKKNKGKDVVRHDSKHVTTDDIKNDKNNINTTEQQFFKKVELSDSMLLEKNSTGDKNSYKENFNYNSSKLDFSNKTGLDKIEKNMKMPDFKENLQEIIDKAKITVRDNRNGSFIVRLSPQELGNVNVNLIMKNGVITGKFLVDNEDVKNILLNNIQELKFQLNEAGIEVGEFSVGVDSRHERNLSSNRDEMLIFPAVDSDKEIITASEIYNSITETHIGHINMII